MSLGFSWVFTRTTSFKGTFGKYEWSHQHALRKKKNQQNRNTWGLKVCVFPLQEKELKLPSLIKNLKNS